MYSSNVKNFQVEIETSPEVFSPICVVSASFDKGESLDTWNDLCNGVSNNVTTAYDPTFAITFKFDSEDEAHKFVVSKKYAIDKDAMANVKMTNKLEKKTIEFLATISNVADELNSEAVTEISCDLKVADAKTFKVSEYMPA